MCPGVWPLAESLCYHVASDHDPNLKYIVDLSAYHGAGACTCSDFQMRWNPYLRAGHLPSPTRTCKHCRRVYRYLAIEVARKILATRKGQAEEMATANGHKAPRYNPELPEY